MRGGRLGYVIKVAGIFAAYFVTARLGLQLDAVSGFATLVWAPTGIALAALLVFGYRYWPGVTLAAFLVNLVTGAPPLVALGIGIGNTLEPLAGAYALNRLGLRKSLDRLKDILGLVILAGMMSTAISATVGVTSLLVGDVISGSAYGSTWLAWWSGDMLGVLVVAPLLLVWYERLRTPLDAHRLVKGLLPVALLMLVSALVFHGFVRAGVRPFVLAYVVFPILIWIALRFSQLGSVSAIFLMAVVSIWGTVVSFDASKGTTLSRTLLLLQVFIGITAVTFMTLAAVVAEREQTLKHQEGLLQKAALLTKQRERLKVLNEAKDEFISIASHQLRTPATSVKQYLGILLAYGELSSEQHNYVQTAYESNERQLKIINDLLHVAQLDSGKLRVIKTSTDITKLLTDVVRHYDKELEKRQQTIAFTHGKARIRAHVDKSLMRMVVENIIDNAAKYSSDGSEITVSLSKTRQRVILQITDQGIGIARADQKRLFRKFSRLPSSHMGDITGTGLGLYWAKKVTRLHGGTIKLTSEPGKGSTFTIDLPV
jgi:signal transduction histidine kinase